jgi:small GTP-binding protein
MADDLRTFRTVLLGPTGVGKTCLFQCFCTHTIVDRTIPTISSCVASATVETDLGLVRIELTDTAGQERSSSLTRLYFRDADCILIVIDGSDPDCILGAARVLSNFQDDIPTTALLHLAVNKYDLVLGIDVTEIATFSRKHKMPFNIVSALMNFQVAEMFKDIARRLIEAPGVQCSPSGEIKFPDEREAKCC